MRRIVLGSFLCALFAGCATTANAPAANEQVVRSLYDAFARGDGATVLGMFDPQIRWMEAENIGYADRNPYIGPQAVAEGIFGRIMSEWSGFRVNVQELVSEGDKVVALGRYTGSFNATRRPLDAQFVHVWTLRDGKVTGFQQYADTLQFDRVMRP